MPVDERPSNHTYRLYGLNVTSTIPFPELLSVPIEGTTDVVVRRVPSLPVDNPLTARPDHDKPYWATPEGIVTPCGDGWLLVRDGSEILMTENCPEDVCSRRLLYWRGFALLAHQRDTLPLHASAVTVDVRTVAFAAPSGVGKSTSVAALCAEGRTLVVDDVALLSPSGDGELRVRPGPPMLKLHPETADRLDLDAMAVEGRDSSPKRLYELADSATVEADDDAAPPALDRLYLLETDAEADTWSVESVDRQEAIREIVAQTYGLPLVSRLDRDGAHLEQCAAVAERVPVRRLTRPTDLSSTAELGHVVEEDLKDVPIPDV